MRLAKDWERGLTEHEGAAMSVSLEPQIVCQVMVIIPPQVLIPVFALGRAQELCILLETFW